MDWEVPAEHRRGFIDQIRKRVLSKDRRLTRADLIFHYTSLATLDAATAGHGFPRLRASSAAFMNDTQEYRHGQNVLSDQIDQMLASETGWRARVLRAAKRLIPGTNQPVYCACFTLVDDDLGQWRGYGDMGRGCILGIDRTILEPHVNGIGCWVTYAPRKQRELAGELLSDYLDAMGALTGQSEHAVGAAARAFTDLHPSLCMLFKHEAFSAEREYRVIYSPTGPTERLVERYLHRSSRIVPYVDLELTDTLVPLRTVRLGPGVSDERTKSAVEAMLEARGVRQPNGAPIEVRYSRIPFMPTT